MKYTLLFSIVLALFFGCSEKTKTAGSASVTTNGTVTGSIQDSTGTAVPEANTILISSDYNPNLSNVGVYRSTFTDSSGKFVFEDVPEGEYRLVVRTADSSQATTITDIQVKEDQTLQVEPPPVSKPGSIRINASDFAFVAGDYFYLGSTDIGVLVTEAMVTAGTIVLSEVPIGEYSQVYLQPHGKTGSIALLIHSIRVTSEELVLVPELEGSSSIPEGFFNQGRSAFDLKGGEGGDTLIVSDTAALRKALLLKEPTVIKLNGLLHGNGEIYHVTSHKSLLGIGDSSGLDSIGLVVVKDSNVVIRNLIFSRSSDDAIGLETANHVWIDHNSFLTCTDGFVDIKRASEWVTISWNVMKNQNSISVIGHSDGNGAQDSTHLHVTLHNNWISAIGGAAPRVRYGTVHVYNNWYDSANSVAVASTQFAKLVLENNVFTQVDHPTDTKHSSLYSGELVARNNILEESSAIDTLGTAFEPSSYYTYTLIAPEQVRTTLQANAGAGRIKALR